MIATILTLLAAAVVIYLLKRQSDKEIAKPAANGGLPNTHGGGGEDTTIKPGDPGYEDLVNTAKGAQGPGPGN